MSNISRRQLLQQATFSVAGLSLARAAVVPSLTLAQDGKSLYSILLSPTASPSEQRAANELQHFLEQISGARLPIITDPAQATDHTILLGQSPALQQLQPNLDLNFDPDHLGTEGYLLKTVGNHLIIAGSRERGTLYGVYGFLEEKLGCRWFTANVSRIPELRTLSIDSLDETHKPSFEYREPFFHEAADKDWAARNRTNGANTDLDASTGGKFQYYPFVHTFALLVPPEKYFKDHPEYFSFVDGKRRDTKGQSQLCLTNPDVLRISIQTVLGWMRDHPEAAIYSVSQNDGTGWCECDNCRAVEVDEGGVHSGPVLRFVNAVAEEVGKQHPDKLIDTLAYWYTEDPPTKARPHKNVRIRLCPIGACIAHPFADCPYDAYFMKHLNAWSEITNQLYIWHYNTNFSNYLLPLPDFDEIAADIPMYSQHGVVGIFFEGSPSQGGGAENAELRSYVMAKLLWDTKANVRKAIDEFHTACYGAAARPMRAYFDLLLQEVRLPPRGHGDHAWIYDRSDAPYLNDAFLAEATRLFQQAEAAAATPATKASVSKARLPIDYVHLTRAKVFTVQGDHYQPANLDALQQKWAILTTNARSLGITEIREHVALTEDEKDFAARIKPYRVVTIQNEHLRVDIVPDLDARVIRIIDKRTNKDLLLHPNPGARQYPDMGGLTIGAQSDYVSAPAWKLTWVLGNTTPTEAVFRATAQNGMTLDRTLRLDGALLRTTTTLTNTSTTAAPALLQTHCDVEAGDVRKAVVTFKNQSDTPIEKVLIQPNLEPSGGQTYTSIDQPNGEWSIAKSTGQTILVNRFSTNQVARCSLSWSAKSEDLVGLSLIAIKKTLNSGDTLTLSSDYSAV